MKLYDKKTHNTKWAVENGFAERTDEYKTLQVSEIHTLIYVLNTLEEK
jgi:hypothetical protein